MRRSRGVSSREWARIRKGALERDGYRCQKCGRAGRLEVHHVLPVYKGGTDDLDNLLSVCRGCHIRITKEESGPQLSPAEAAWERLIQESMEEIEL